MTVVLHHYEGSLFSEKIRLMFGYYGLAWRSVEISPIMPRPDLMPLTGGYRRTPVLQHGADIFCDTHAISEYLDVLCPDKALVPPALAHGARSLAERADTHLFQVAVALCFQPAAVAPMMAALGPEMAEKFAADRAQLSGGEAALLPSARGPPKAHFRQPWLPWNASWPWRLMCWARSRRLPTFPSTIAFG